MISEPMIPCDNLAPNPNHTRYGSDLPIAIAIEHTVHTICVPCAVIIDVKMLRLKLKKKHNKPDKNKKNVSKC